MDCFSICFGLLNTRVFSRTCTFTHLVRHSGHNKCTIIIIIIITVIIWLSSRVNTPNWNSFIQTYALRIVHNTNVHIPSQVSPYIICILSCVLWILIFIVVFCCWKFCGCVVGISCCVNMCFLFVHLLSWFWNNIPIFYYFRR